MGKNDSSESSSSSTDSSSSSDTPATNTAPMQPLGQPQPGSPRVGQKRKARKVKRKPKRRRTSTSDAIKYLTEQVSGIKDFIAGSVAFQPAFHSHTYNNEQCNSDISADISGELFSDHNETSAPPELPVPSCSFDMQLQTVLKEPTVPKSSSSLVELINNIQHFGTEEWGSVRYADVQKQYCSSPGFNYLETNDEIKPYDKSNSLALIERGFAAITLALIKQNSAIQSGFKHLVEWAQTAEQVSPKSLEDKVNEIFIKGDFQKISSDVLQLACGHRAELIQQRRDNILRSVKDNFLKASLRKIPPTCETLFNKEPFSSAIEKGGGVTKVFWPLKAPSNNKTAAQAQSQMQAQVPPSYASNFAHNKPPFYFGTNYQQPDTVNRMPMPFMNYPPQFRDYPRPSARQSTQPPKSLRQRHNRPFPNTEGYTNNGRAFRNSQPPTRGHAKRRF